MPDSSGELPSSSHEPSEAPRTAPVGAPLHLNPAPRLHPPSGRQSREAPAPPPPPGLPEVLEWVRRYGAAGVAPTEAVGEADQSKQTPRSLLSKEQRKFHKFDPEHPEPEPPRARTPLSPSEQDESAPFADYPGGITSEQIAFIRRLRQEPPDRNLWVPLGVALLSFLFVVGAFLAGHFSPPKFLGGSPAPALSSEKPLETVKASATPSAAALELVDQAMAAEKARNYPKAIDLLEQAQHETGHVEGLNYHLAVLCYKANEVARVLPLLNLSIAEGEEVAACYNFRGTLSDGSGSTDRSPGDLEKATLIDPFDARYLFVWGEALRRAGKLEQALVQFRRAYNRAPEGPLASEYALKVRLTQIELGQQDQFASEMATELKLTPPPADWLFTAAAVEMHRNNYAAAAEHLDKVRSLIGETATRAQLQDTFFAGFAHETDLAKFFEVSTSSELPAAP